MRHTFDFEDSFYPVPPAAVDANPATAIRDLLYRVARLEQSLGEQRVQAAADTKEMLLEFISLSDDITNIAERWGLATAEINNHQDIREKVRGVLQCPGPVICTVKTSADEKTAPRVTSMLRPDGVIVSKPMEDMAPFLDREEFLSNMIIPPLAE
jgi:hypothetical protein